MLKVGGSYSDHCNAKLQGWVWTINMVTVDNNKHVKGKGKAVPLQACSGPEGSGKLRFPDYMTTAQDGAAPAAFAPRKYSWYSFLLEAESTPGP